MELVRGMKAVVIGLGAAGLSTVKYLLRQGVRVGVSDQAAEELIEAAHLAWLRDAGVELEFGGHTPACLEGADVVVPGPGVPLQSPIIHLAGERGLPLIGELGLAAGRFQAPVVAVTGSNGKTTVTSLIGALLETAGKHPFVGGNIGRPLLDYFADPDSYGSVVLELSSFQLDLAGDFRPDVGLLLNISPDHLDRHGSLEAYAAAKMRLFTWQRAGDAALLGGDDPLADAVRPPAGVVSYRFGRKAGHEALVSGGQVTIAPVMDGAGTAQVYSLAETRLHSSVNQLNAAAAILAATLCGCRPDDIRSGLRRFQPPPHRMAEVACIDGVRFINDSKATNVGAMQAALAGCDAPVVLIAGGRGKGSDYGAMITVIRDKVKHLILLGEDAERMRLAWGEVVRWDMAATMEEAVYKARDAAASGELVLLAPGCASYDMFSGYEERGSVFAECVRRLADPSRAKGSSRS